jgi:hypothetical protein
LGENTDVAVAVVSIQQFAMIETAEGGIQQIVLTILGLIVVIVLKPSRSTGDGRDEELGNISPECRNLRTLW